MKAISKSPVCVLLTAMLMLLSGCGQNRYAQFGGYAQGGTWGVKANLKGVKERPEAIQKKIDDILYEIDTTLSGYNKASQLSRINAGEEVTPSPMLLEVVEAAKRFKEESDGAVDCFAGALFDKWGFGFGPGMNFNAIAQGYSCDKVAEYLYGIGVKDMLVDIGEIYCDGFNPSGKPWRIGVDKPTDGNDKPGAELDGIWESDGGPQGIVTSGNYRKFYIKDGKKFSHTIDPRTGNPVEHNLLSASIVAKSAMEADAYATYCMVIGLDAAKEFILSREDLEGYLIFGDFETWASPGFNLVKQ
ncbi:MAG: FAD:protein FMN transferase [Bacteroidales bacterium]|nr:FAD:protein FMN transferase [Bacteroidales bacterium]